MKRAHRYLDRVYLLNMHCGTVSICVNLLNMPCGKGATAVQSYAPGKRFASSAAYSSV